MIKKYYIYLLRHPTTKEIRYIGKTGRSLKKRLSEHVSPSKLNNEKCHKSSWVKSLLKVGLKPEIILTKESNEENFIKDEINTIKEYREKGYRLVNGTDGGEGHLGYKKSPESIEKTRIGLLEFHKNNPGIFKGKIRSKEHSENISLGKIGKIPNISEESRISRSNKIKALWENENFRKTESEKRKVLTSEQEKEVRSMYLDSKNSVKDIANKFGVSRSTITAIAYRNREEKVERKVNSGRLNYSQVLEILEKSKQGLTGRAISKIYEVHEETIGNILRGRSHVNTKGWQKFLGSRK